MFFSIKKCTLEIADNYLVRLPTHDNFVKNSFPFLQFCFRSNLNLLFSYLAYNVYLRWQHMRNSYHR